MSTPFRICACGKTASTEQELELFSKNPTCKYGRANICIECHNKKCNTLYNPKNNAIRKIKNTPIKIPSVIGICKLCFKTTEIFEFHPDNSPKTILFCAVCLDLKNTQKTKYEERVRTLSNMIAETEGDEKQKLINSLQSTKQGYKNYFSDNFK